MKCITLVLVGVLLSVVNQKTFAQISYVEEPNVSALYQKYVSQNKGTMYTLGYRLQILSTSDRRRMETTKKRFMSEFPDLVPASAYEAPNYKLRVGAFKTKLETVELRQRLRSAFPSVFPVKDNKIRPVEYL